MTSDESSKLQTKYQELKSQRGLRYAVYALGVILLMLTMGMLWDMLTKDEVTSSYVLLLLFGISLCLAIGYVAIRFWLTYLRKVELIERDLSVSTKVVIEGIIQAKREGRWSASYFFTVNDTEYTVDASSYSRFDTHQSVIISLTTSAQVIVSITALEREAIAEESV